MFSSRTLPTHGANRLSVALARAREGGRRIVDLTASNPTAVGLPVLGAGGLSALSQRGVTRYEPEPMGLREAREAVAGYYRDHGHAVPVDDIVLTASTSEAYGWLFKLLCDPGDAVLVAQPSYPLFDELARLEQVELRPFHMAYEGRWELDLGALERALTPRCRAVLLVHPNNPTGSFVAKDVVPGLVDVCARHAMALVADEVFLDYAWEEDARRAGSFVGVTGVPTFVLSGLSKVACLPQMKLGWIVARGPDAERAEALRRLELIADCYLSVNTPVQRAAGALLAGRGEVQGAVRERVATNREALRRAVGGESAATVMGAEGGWYATLRVPATVSEEERALRLLERDGVLVHPGYFFDFEREAYLVVSLLTEPAAFAEGIAAVASSVERE